MLSLVLSVPDGEVFAFGDAHLSGSMSGRHFNGPIVGIATSATGYLLGASDGGVFAFGNAPMFGSMSAKQDGRTIVGIAAMGNRHVVAASDGARFSFSASMHGAEAATAVDARIVGIG